MTKDTKTLEEWIGFSKEEFSSLLSAPEKKEATLSAPFMISLADIREDPNQPRTEKNAGFSAKSIEKIGRSIQERGVKSPISLRIDPSNPKKFIINHGARRFRGAQWAKQTNIPAFIDEAYSPSDQMIENIQRKNLNPLEIAAFIQKNPQKKADIAHMFGKSPSFVSRYSKLLDLPPDLVPWVQKAHINDITLINEICVEWKKNPQQVLSWLEESQKPITRTSMRSFRKERKETSQKNPHTNRKKGKTIVLRARHRGIEGTIALNPSTPKTSFCCFTPDKGEEMYVSFSALQIIAIE